MRKIFVLIDRVGLEIEDSTWELATTARQADGTNENSVTGVVLGKDVSSHMSELSRWFDEVVVFDDEMLAVPDGEVTAAVLTPLLKRETPFCVLAAHANDTMDFMPALAIRLGRPLITDCISIDLSGDTISAIRPAYGGKIHAKVTAAFSETGYIATIRPGSIRPGECPEANGRVRVEAIPDGMKPRRRFVETVASDPGEIDITQAERLVAVGRGIEDEEGVELIESLAKALGAEVACSRPIVDKQWLPKSRQVGTSGKTVRPKLYLAIGISGSFQHIGGVKGDPFLVAINKDPKAPIFSVADVGIVADLYDVVPLLNEKINSLKG